MGWNELGTGLITSEWNPPKRVATDHTNSTNWILNRSMSSIHTNNNFSDCQSHHIDASVAYGRNLSRAWLGQSQQQCLIAGYSLLISSLIFIGLLVTFHIFHSRNCFPKNSLLESLNVSQLAMSMNATTPIPGPPPLPILGNLLDLDRENTIKSWVDLASIYGPIYKLRLGGADRTFVTGHELVG
jgi:hypothetical protein